MKQLTKKDRLESGNKNTDLLREYLSKRTGEILFNTNGNIFDIFGVDFASTLTGKFDDIKDIKNSYQGKVRVTKFGLDFIYEACIFRKRDGDFKIEPGRDSRGISNLYACLTCTRDNIKIVDTKQVKEKVKYYLNEWWGKLIEYDLKIWAQASKMPFYEMAKEKGIEIDNFKCTLPDMTDEDIRKYWNLAFKSYNKDYIVYKSEECFFDQEIYDYVEKNPGEYSKSPDYYANKHVEIHFKIDEGYDNWSEMAKILVYLPYPIFKCGKIIKYREKEDWNCPETWEV